MTFFFVSSNFGSKQYQRGPNKKNKKKRSSKIVLSPFKKLTLEAIQNRCPPPINSAQQVPLIRIRTKKNCYYLNATYTARIGAIRGELSPPQKKWQNFIEIYEIVKNV